MTTLREAAQQALEALKETQRHRAYTQGIPDAITALRKALPCTYKCEAWPECGCAALAQEEQATGKEPLQVDLKGGMQIATPLPLTTTDLAWLETRRLVHVWKELGQMRWTGADEGWDRAIEAVRARLDKECQDVLAWKEKMEASGETAAQLLQKLRGMKDE
jgi:hypothetical protein